MPVTLARRSKLRQFVSRLRRSPAVQYAQGVLELRRRSIEQRRARRFVVGAWRTTPAYLRAAAGRGEVAGPRHPRGIFHVPGPTYVPGSAEASVGEPMGVRFDPGPVYRLRGALVVPPHGAIIGADRRLLWDLSYDWPGRLYQHSAYSMATPREVSLDGPVITLAAMAAGGNYFHFLFNSVARLVYLPQPRDIPPLTRWLVNGPVTPLVAEAFALFGLDPQQLIDVNAAPAWRVADLLAPPLIQNQFVVPPHACEFLRRHVLPHTTCRERRRRIFVDRSDAPRRQIANLRSLEAALERFGVEVVQLTGLSLVDQASLFRSAELVIANHGAALSNLVFCEPRTRVIQILAPGMMEREYRTLSHHGGLRHDYLVAPFARADDEHLPVKDRDLALDPDFLQQTLKREGWLRSLSGCP